MILVILHNKKPFLTHILLVVSELILNCNKCTFLVKVARQFSFRFSFLYLGCPTKIRYFF